MRRGFVLLLIPLLFFAAGCVDIDIDTKIQENGSGTQTWRFTGTALLASEIKKQIENNPFFGKSITRDQFKEGDYILESTIPFRDVSELRNVDRDVRFVSQGWLLKTHTYTEVWKSSGEAGGFLAQRVRGIVPVTLRISVELPGTIVESNADSKEGGVARWNIPVADLATSKILIAKSRSFNWVFLVPSALGFLCVISALFFLVYSRARKSRLPAVPTVACAACGASVPDGSTFCSFCGNRMNQGYSQS